jgi:DNA-binding response OmpR family regulator
MPPTILLADDEPSLRELLGEALEDEGYIVRTAADGQEAWTMLQRQDIERPALVLTDVRMPRLDGIGLVGQINKHMPGLPVLVMTAHGDKDLVLRLLRAGVSEYVDKPVSAEDLVAQVRRLLTGSASGHPREELQRVQQEMSALIREEVDQQEYRILDYVRGGVRHRFNQPLTVLHANLQLLKKLFQKAEIPVEYEPLADEVVRDMETSAIALTDLVTLLSCVQRLRTETYIGKERILDFEASAAPVVES